MGYWDTTYTPNLSPFSYNAVSDQIAGLSPFGKKSAGAIGDGMKSFGASMGGGGSGHPLAGFLTSAFQPFGSQPSPILGLLGIGGEKPAEGDAQPQEDPQQAALMRYLKTRGLA